MTHVAPNPGGITTNLVAQLRADTSRPVGDGESPFEGQQLGDGDLPFCYVEYIVPAPIADARGMLQDHDRHLTYQVTSVGIDRESADDMAQLVRRCITDFATDELVERRVPLGTADTAVIGRTFNSGSGTRRVDGGLWNCPDRYQLTVSTL